MDVEDLRHFPDGSEITTDLCIVGSGPAGLTIATELRSTGVRILVVESGGRQQDPDVEALSRVESIGAPRILDESLTRNRLFGGTSHSWSGRCAPFEDLDFAARRWIPYSGWPMTRAELDPFIRRANPHLGLDDVSYGEELWTMAGRPHLARDIDPALLRHCFWQYSSDPDNAGDFMRFGPAFKTRSGPDTRILLHATATEICLDDDARVSGVQVSTLTGTQARIRARVVVLCAGAIENARLMLGSRRSAPTGIGNQNDLVGRFLMDHPRCSLGEFNLAEARRIQEHYGLFRLRQKTASRFFVRGIALSPALQERARLLNCAAWLTEHRADDDPWNAIKRLKSGHGRRAARDIWVAASQPGLLVRGLNDRLVRRRGVPHKLHRLVMDCIVEQCPDPESRITLSDRVDRLGQPLARLDWRISDREVSSVAMLGRLMRDEFRRAGLPVPRLADWIEHDRPQEARFHDASHPIGTTRMARDARLGVVDENCRVHGLEGLYVGGSSVFPSSGHANPTLMIVALAVRLAAHLEKREFGGASLPGPSRGAARGAARNVLPLADA